MSNKLYYLAFLKYTESCNFNKNSWSNEQNKTTTHWDSFLSIYHFAIWYIVWLLPVLITACMYLGILYMRFWHTSGAISFHSSTNLSHNTYTPLGEILYLENCQLTCFHRCSIWLRSGDCAGNNRSFMSLFQKNYMAFLEVCFGSLSCWKYCSPTTISDFLKLSTILSPKIWQSWLAFIFSLTSISIPILFQPIHTHTIRLFHPSHFTVANVGQYKMNLTLFFHTYTILFDPIISIIVLSDYKTVFQSSTVQFSCSWANSRCLQ